MQPINWITDITAAGQIIDELGGTNAVARLCRTTKGAVSQWRRNGIPVARELYLRAIRPEVFPKLGADCTAHQPIQAAELETNVTPAAPIGVAPTESNQEAA